MGEREKGGEGGGENALGAVHRGVCLEVGGGLGGSRNKQHPFTHTPPCVYPAKNSPPLFWFERGDGGAGGLIALERTTANNPNPQRKGCHV